MSMDNGMGAAIGAIGPIMAVGLVSQVASNTMRSVGNSYRSNQRSYRQPSHSHSQKTHAFSMHKGGGGGGKKSSGRKESYSIWKGTGF